MSLTAQAALDAVIALATQLPGMQRVYRGAPESLANAVCAYVWMGGGVLLDRATGGVQRRTQHIWVVLAYRVGGNEATTENNLCAQLDALDTALATPEGRTLDTGTGPLVLNARLDRSQADSPQYAVIAGVEYRLYPVIVVFEQDLTFQAGG